MCFFYHSALSLSIILPPVLSVPDRTNIQYLQLHLPYFDSFLDVIIYLFVSHLFVFQKLYPLFLSVMLTPDGANILGKKSEESVYYSLSVDLNKRGFGNSNICEMEWFGLLCCVGESRVGYIFSKPILFLPMFFPDDQDFFKILTHISPHIITYFYTSSNVVYIFIFFKLSPR